MIRRLVAVLFLLAAGCGVAASSADDIQNASGTDTVQQVLVLLRMPPQHFRPGEGYSGGYVDGIGRSARRRVATQLAREHGLTLASDWPMPLLGVDCFVMTVPGERAAESVALLLSRDPRVEWAQTTNVYRAKGYNDPLYSVQPVAYAWGLSDLHEIATGRKVRVAVVDSGIDEQHPDLAGQVAISENFVDRRRYAAEQHGTAVAGIIAARANNGVGIVGVAPDARLLALRACWQETAQDTLCTSLSLAKALHFAIAHDAEVINLSLSGPQDKLLRKLLDAALARGISVVTAVDSTLPDGGFPASHLGVVAVAGEPSTSLSSGVLVAPGRDVPTTLPGARWGLVAGSSYAAAHITGLLALLRERGPPRAGTPLVAGVVRLAAGEIDACATLMPVAGGNTCVRTVTRFNHPSLGQ